MEQVFDSNLVLQASCELSMLKQKELKHGFLFVGVSLE